MVNFLRETSSAVTETLKPTTPPFQWPSDLQPDLVTPSSGFKAVTGLEPQQLRHLERISSLGVFWKNPEGGEGIAFRLSHGGDVDSDGNCLFTSAIKAISNEKDPIFDEEDSIFDEKDSIFEDAREMRRKCVERFMKDYEADDGPGRDAVKKAIRNLYAPDLEKGWGIHVVQEVKLIVRKLRRPELDKEIHDLVDSGMQREVAAESIYKERCIPVDDGKSWAKYMLISGSPDDEHDIITLQYTEEGLLTVDENRDGRAAAFGDDIAIESLATEFKREVYVVQAHGSDAMVEEENCVFFLPHRPRGVVCGSPIFLFMKGTGWCGAGADHYEPLIATPLPLVSQEKAAIVL